MRPLPRWARHSHCFNGGSKPFIIGRIYENFRAGINGWKVRFGDKTEVNHPSLGLAAAICSRKADCPAFGSGDYNG